MDKWNQRRNNEATNANQMKNHHTCKIYTYINKPPCDETLTLNKADRRMNK